MRALMRSERLAISSGCAAIRSIQPRSASSNGAAATSAWRAVTSRRRRRSRATMRSAAFWRSASATVPERVGWLARRSESGLSGPHKQLARDQKDNSENQKKSHERVAVAIDESEDADARIEQSDERRGEPRAHVARAQPLPHPDERDAEREHASAHEVPDDIDHRAEVGLDGKRVEHLMHVLRLQSVAEGAEADDDGVEQKQDGGQRFHHGRSFRPLAPASAMLLMRCACFLCSTRLPSRKRQMASSSRVEYFAMSRAPSRAMGPQMRSTPRLAASVISTRTPRRSSRSRLRLT